MSLFKMVAKRDVYMQQHIYGRSMKLDTKKKISVNFISPGKIRTMLNAMKEMVVKHIVESISKQQKACIIFDGTHDYSKKEASVLLAIFLKNNCDGRQYPKERLLEVFTTGETTGAVLKEEVMGVLGRLNFDCQWIIGQFYDGAGNMRGKRRFSNSYSARMQQSIIHLVPCSPIILSDE